MQEITIIKKPRKTMTITIKPDGSVFVYAPTGYPDHKINQRIHTKQARIERTQQRVMNKQPKRLATNDCLLFFLR